MSNEENVSHRGLVPSSSRELVTKSSSLVQRGLALIELELDPSFIEIYHRRGIRRDTYCDYHQAIQDFTQVIQLDPKYSHSHGLYAERGDAYKHIGAYHQAINDLSEAIRIDPENYRPHLWLAGIYDGIGEYRKAIQHLTEILANEKQEKNNAFIHLWVGEFYQLIGNMLRSRWHHDRALQLDDHEAKLMDYPEETTLSYKENYIISCSKYIQENPQDPEGYRKRASAYDEWGTKQSAVIDDYTRVIELKPDDYDVYHSRGWQYVFMRRFLEALEDGNYCVKIRPDSHTGYHLRGWAYEMLGSNHEAVCDYAKVIELQPERDIYYYRRGRVYEKLGEYSKSISSYTEIISLKENHKLENQTASTPAFYYYWRGWAFEKLGDHNRACEDFHEAARLGDKDSIRYLQLLGTKPT